MKRSIALSLCAAFAVAFTAAQAGDNVLTIKSGQTQAQFQLKSNPTTGYRWYFKRCSHGVKPVSANYVANNSKLVGAPGMVTWTFKLSKINSNVPRVMRCDLVYMRAWDPMSATSKTLWFVAGG